MKKNIQINLFGTLYNIDDDAYKLLERYLDSMRGYFARQEGGEEIADDIEHRVAELLWQKRREGMEAVDIYTVREIIGTIGNPQDIDDDAATDAAEASVQEQRNQSQPRDGLSGGGDGATSTAGIFSRLRQHIKERRLYRNGDDKRLGGVCSGLAEYTGTGDVTLWRIAFLVLPFVLGGVLGKIVDGEGAFLALPLLYLMLWIVVPEASTAEDRLRMRGQRVTPESINEEILSESEHGRAYSAPPRRNNGCLTVLLVLVLLVLAFPVLVLTIGSLVAIFGASSLMIGSGVMDEVMGGNMDFVYDYVSNHGWLVLTGVLAALLVICIPVYLLAKKLFSGRVGGRTLTLSLVVWVLMLMLAWTLFSLVVSSRSLHTIKYSHFQHTVTSFPADSVAATADTAPSTDELVDSIAIDAWGDEWD